MRSHLSPSEKVYDFIMEKISSKEWVPNTKIMSEHQLCAELNVSRISVREATEKLVALGILERKRGSGTIVKELKPSFMFQSLVSIIALNQNDIRNILEFRLHFEPANIIMFMEHVTPDQVEQLKHYYKMMQEHAMNHEQFYLYDFYFHNAIAKGTKNPIVINISEILHSLMRQIIKRLYSEVGPQNALYYHKAIIEAIEERDAELAALMMKRHIQKALKHLPESES